MCESPIPQDYGGLGVCKCQRYPRVHILMKSACEFANVYKETRLISALFEYFTRMHDNKSHMHNNKFNMPCMIISPIRTIISSICPAHQILIVHVIKGYDEYE